MGGGEAGKQRNTHILTPRQPQMLSVRTLVNTHRRLQYEQPRRDAWLRPVHPARLQGHGQEDTREPRWPSRSNPPPHRQTQTDRQTDLHSPLLSVSSGTSLLSKEYGKDFHGELPTADWIKYVPADYRKKAEASRKSKRHVTD